ncbi:NLP/P60 protein [Solidesulfovibrio carbinoliphilus subsp. oakridgensis]|uniref:NLP/P60 protein n=1 Tax=Solidesulfovibrio carbinoliphilus subsp. oakridgensis TaxID=694327 RepID=G7Q6B8_9BACT|nr:C40 family peptidase [Solidesulfovibrio carbinoliphilus]EHJ47291.1 NLP/P60 protein [Solidesulfovibrio carbinoliphilus subsp. oakridgensis]
MTDAHAHTLHKLKPVVLLALLALLTAGCSSKSKTYSYQFDDYQGFNARNDFITHGDSEERLKADAEQNLLSGNLFAQGSTPTPKRAGGPEKVISENLFEVASVQRKGGVYDRMLRTANTQIGTPYRSGGCNPNTGFDCSGFTTWVFNRYGIHLPRSSREQYQMGTMVAKNNLRKGDLVFFRSKRGVNHVGIYLENGKFIHSASNGKTVTISHLEEDYWRTHYAGGRRVF